MNPVLGKFVFDDPTKLVYGEGVLKELPDYLKAMGATSVMLVCDQGIVKAGLADKL